MKKTTKIATLILAVITLMCLWVLPASAAIIPATPTGLEAEPWSDEVELYWDDVSYADGYRVFVYKNGGWKKLADVEDTYYSVEDLIASSTYVFAVRSYRKNSNGYTWSSSFPTVKVTTDEMSDDITAKAVAGTTSVNVSWTKVSGCSGYRVFRYENKKWVKVKDIAANNYSYTVTGLEGLTNYYFTVRPYAKTTSGVQWGATANVVKVKTKNALQVQLSAVSDEKSVTLSWDKVEGATGYRVFIRQNGAWKALKTLGGTSYTVTSLNSDTYYYFCARAYKKVNGVVSWMPLSESLKYATEPSVSDLKVYRVAELDKLLRGNYLMEATIYDEEYGDTVVTMAVRNGYVYYGADNEGIKIIFNPKTNKNYTVLDEYKAYLVEDVEDYDNDYIGDTDFPIEEYRGKTTVSIADLDGKKVICESYTDTDDLIYRLYFEDDTLIAYDLDYKLMYSGEFEDGEDTYIRVYVTKFSTSVPTTYFAVPSGYTRITEDDLWEMMW